MSSITNHIHTVSTGTNKLKRLQRHYDLLRIKTLSIPRNSTLLYSIEEFQVQANGYPIVIVPLDLLLSKVSLLDDKYIIDISNHIPELPIYRLSYSDIRVILLSSRTFTFDIHSIALMVKSRSDKGSIRIPYKEWVSGCILNSKTRGWIIQSTINIDSLVILIGGHRVHDYSKETIGLYGIERIRKVSGMGLIKDSIDLPMDIVREVMEYQGDTVEEYLLYIPVMPEFDDSQNYIQVAAYDIYINGIKKDIKYSVLESNLIVMNGLVAKP